MATYGQALRRGLPRLVGGEPWPAVNGDGAGSAGGAGGSAAGAGTPGPLVAPVEAASVPAGEGRVLRRGLPRVAGGEAWPAAGTVAAASARRTEDAGAATADPHIATVEQALATSAEAPAAPASAQRTQGAGVVAADSHAAPVAPDAVVLRRGLPRVAGGEAWPAAGTVATASARRTEDAGAPAGGPQIATVDQAGADAATSTTAEAPTPATTATATPATTATPAATTRAPVDLAVPLSVPRTVWPGAAALTRPAPRPEPARIGPFTKGQWAGAVLIGGAGLLFAAAMAVLAVRWFLSLEFMQEFLVAYPGEYELPEGAPVGIPPWLGWQHFFNIFLIVLIIRSGLQVRSEKRPSVFWSPRGGNGRRKMSLNLWFHQGLDIFWVVNGAIFIVLLFVTGQWMKIVPTSWEVFPNALSAALQYVSLDWPTENGWVNYNSLQQLAYFTTVFLAAPLAIATGVRMSHIWPKDAQRLNKAYPVEWARAVHFPVMLYFVLFIIAHVTLVFATGALRNLNHMYASQDAVNWAGFWIFAASMLVVAGGWIAARPLVLAPIARLFGTVTGR